ncbi:MAG: sel1 repeat family protein [Bacteroidales bacterium]|nr:sel1 repeat family protein [Bacteroidales bacterium]
MKYDVFISYNDSECQSMLKVRDFLISHGISVFTHLTVEDQSLVDDALLNSHIVMLFCGQDSVLDEREVKDRELAEEARIKTFEVRPCDAENNLDSLAENVRKLIGIADDGVDAMRKAAENGDPDAQYNYARMFHKNWGVEYNPGEAARWSRLSALQGNARGECFFACRLLHGQGVEENHHEAFEWFVKAAEQDLPEAQNQLYIMYLNGDGVNKDPEAAYKWLERSVSWGNCWAQLVLGVAYFYGNGIEQNYCLAYKWFMKAAGQNNKIAINFIGYMYHEGLYVQRDSGTAFDWYMKGALMGYDCSQYNIGVMYRDGDGMPRDDEEAVKWLTKSAEQDNAEAQYTLGHCYREGRGVEKNDTVAVEWYRRASDNGHKMGYVIDYIARYLGHHPDEHFDFAPDDYPWGENGKIYRVENGGNRKVESGNEAGAAEERHCRPQRNKLWVILLLLAGLAAMAALLF